MSAGGFYRRHHRVEVNGAGARPAGGGAAEACAQWRWRIHACTSKRTGRAKKHSDGGHETGKWVVKYSLVVQGPEWLIAATCTCCTGMPGRCSQARYTVLLLRCRLELAQCRLQPRSRCCRSMARKQELVQREWCVPRLLLVALFRATIESCVSSCGCCELAYWPSAMPFCPEQPLPAAIATAPSTAGADPRRTLPLPNESRHRHGQPTFSVGTSSTPPLLARFRSVPAAIHEGSTLNCS